MGTMTVWYKITGPDYPWCKNPCTLVSGLEPQDAERVARALYNELRYIVGEDAGVMTWCD